MINITKELLEEESDNPKSKKQQHIQWKSGDKCMAIWRVDGKYYSATVDQILEDGSCTVIFDGYSSSELTQVQQLMPRNKNSTALNSEPMILNKANPVASGNKKPFTK